MANDFIDIIEEAADGTIVLRDVDALSLAMQAQLLATLQGHGGPHGGHDFSPVSARIDSSARVASRSAF